MLDFLWCKESEKLSFSAWQHNWSQTCLTWFNPSEKGNEKRPVHLLQVYSPLLSISSNTFHYLPLFYEFFSPYFSFFLSHVCFSFCLHSSIISLHLLLFLGNSVGLTSYAWIDFTSFFLIYLLAFLLLLHHFFQG